MNAPQIIASLLFGLGYLGIILEHRAHVNKAAFALVMGGLLWIVVGVHNPQVVESTLLHSTADIFSIVIFLLAAMILVEVLAHYRIFDYIQVKLAARNLNMRGQYWFVAVLTFLLSAVLNNLTVTIVMIQIARKFFWGRNLLIMAAAIVVASNAGGAFSPIGDVTTIMMWFAGKFSSGEIFLGGVLPSLTLFLVTGVLLYLKLTPEEKGVTESEHKECPRISPTDRTVIVTVALAFFLPVVARFMGVPPVIGILLGVGITWLVIDSLRQFTHERTHLNASIEGMIQKTDMASIEFFIGILLSVSALHALGLLDLVSHYVYGSQSFNAVVFGNVFLGVISGVFDNIPLTAVALQVLQTQATSLWVLLAITVGTGGSLLLVGSASGVIAAGMVRKLTFMKYWKIAFFPTLLGFVMAVGVWYLQYVIV